MNYTVEKNKVRFACVACKARLTTKLSKAGQADVCPNCNAQFRCPGTAELKLQNQKKQAEKNKAARSNAPSTAKPPKLKTDFAAKAQKAAMETTGFSDFPLRTSKNYTTEKTSLKSGVGFLFQPKTFLESDIYHYENNGFPALAAAIRYYALAAKIIWHIIRIGIVVFAAIYILIWAFGFLGFGFSIFSSSFSQIGLSALQLEQDGFNTARNAMQSAEQSSGVIGYLVNFLALLIVPVFIVLVGIILFLLNNLYLVLSLAILEIARVLLKIESNTRSVT